MPEAAVVTGEILGLGQLAFLGLDNITGILGIVLGFGVLIFVHELGHFLAAKWAGVRVEVFSLGFGPRLIGFERGTTDYRISALPLGGYVKMLGQDDGDPNAPRTNEPDDFRNQTAFKRMVILIAGVVMNTIFAVVAFVAAFAIGIEFGAPEVGFVEPNRAAARAKIVGDASGQAQGLQPGDQILSIDGSSVLGWEDIQTMAALSGGHCVIEVARPTPSGVPVRLTLEATPQKEEGEPIPRLGIASQPVVRLFADDSPAKGKGILEKDELVDASPVVAPGEPAAVPSAAMIRSADQVVDSVVTANPGRPVRVKVRRRAFDADGNPLPQPPTFTEVEVTPLARPVYGIGVTFGGEPRVTAVTANSPAKGALEAGDVIVSLDGHAVDFWNLRTTIQQVGVEKQGAPVQVVFERLVAGKRVQRDATVALQKSANSDSWFFGVRYAQQRVAAVAKDSPAAKAGVEAGDTLLTCSTDKTLGVRYKAGHEIESGDRFREFLVHQGEAPWQLAWEKPDGTVRKDEVRAQPTGETYGDVGITLGPRPIVIRRGASAACELGALRTVMTIRHLVQTIHELFTRNVSTSELGGPIQIASITYKIASSSGFGKLLYFLAILSVNLAVLNILPIPVLDGGHLFLLSLEKLKGRPLSDDVNRYVQYAGFLFVIGLMLYVTFNDIRRFFE